MALHLNRIRVIYRQDKDSWSEYRETLLNHEISEEDKEEVREASN